jgi:hypothetical protein
VVKNTNYKKRRSHNTAEPINGISKVHHVPALGAWSGRRQATVTHELLTLVAGPSL